MKNNLQIFTDIEDCRWSSKLENLEKIVSDVKDAVFDTVADEVSFLKSGKDFSINLCLSSDEQVRQLNKEFRHMDKPTNVLSFAAIDDEDFSIEATDEISLGDVIVAYETMVREAEEQGVSLHDHFCHLWTHGILHVLGYDHIKQEDAAVMEAWEIKILQKLGIDDPYRE